MSKKIPSSGGVTKCRFVWRVKSLNFTNLQVRNEFMKSATIAFYNTENFFDTTDTPRKFDNEYSPTGSMKWTEKRYRNKVWKISRVISLIGMDETAQPPLIVGLAEIESKKVLSDLIHSEHLDAFDYDFVHYESPDERGIDNALIYRKDLLELVSSEPIGQTFERESGRIDYTRDTLYVKFKLEGSDLHVLVAHLPSRRDDDVNLEFRNLIMKGIRNKIDLLLKQNPDNQIILMGDLNGNPDDVNARKLLRTTGELHFENGELYNPMLKFEKNTGSLKYEHHWILFDQMLFSKSFFDAWAAIKFESAHIYSEALVREWDRNFKGSPFRTYNGTKYLGGYSDHFPVYSLLNY